MRILFSINNSLALLRSPRAPAPIRSLLFGSKKSSSVSRSAAAFSSAMSIPPSISAASHSEEALAGKLWIKFNRECLFSMYSPFAVSLAAGNLKIETFRQYIAQDVHFLKAFAHAYELAAECADDDDDKLAISNLRKSVMDELKMHDSFVQDWDLDINKEVSVNSATLRYTEFLLATASGKVEGLKAPGMLDTPFEKTKVAAYTLGAVTPCMKLYAFLGKEFGALLDSSEVNHPYKKWIENYSSDAFQASAKQTEDLLEKLSVCMTGEELDIIEKLYQQAMKLEVEFFHAQPLAQPTIVPLLKNHSKDELMIFSDFDLTCTVVDSSAILAEIAIVTAPKDDQGQQVNRMLSADLKNTWSLLSKQYTEHYEECIESILNKEKADKFDYEGLCEALEQLSEFEKKANDRVIESGVLKGLNLDDIKRAGERLILQDGCVNVFQKILKTQDLNAKLHVLSYCWCGDLIRTAFSARGVDAVEVHANEFTFEESISTGEIERKVESPIDKAQQFKSILQNREKDEEDKEEKSVLTVYIGDSVGDLLCLLEADIGIVVASSSSLRRVGSHFGVSFVPLFSGIVQKQKQEETWKGLSGTLYTVSSWAEIHSFALGWE
ncbi:hypothetical protein N665_0355s0014 [Sinapis alba]|nr:hypothetical protein N665_0355s0014 [Sinapis alba]